MPRFSTIVVTAGLLLLFSVVQVLLIGSRSSLQTVNCIKSSSLNQETKEGAGVTKEKAATPAPSFFQADKQHFADVRRPAQGSPRHPIFKAWKLRGERCFEKLNGATAASCMTFRLEQVHSATTRFQSWNAAVYLKFPILV
jgi:hypothetical protein